MKGSHDVARLAFEQAATALESVVAKGDPADRDRDFHHVMAATAYHLGRFSARAYSLLVRVHAEGNFSPLERALCLLILRNLDELERLVLAGRLGGIGSDASLVAYFEQQWGAREVAGPLVDGDAEGFALEGLDRALTERFFAAISLFLFALERGERELVEQSKALLREGYTVCADLNLVPQWWSYRVTIHLIDDLWSSSFHERLPVNPDGGGAPQWPQLRQTFIALLLRRGRSEIDLWPSQLSAADRVVN